MAQKKTSAIISAYQAGVIDLQTARMELQTLNEETGIFGKITDEMLSEGAGVNYADAQAMHDPLGGIFGGE